jgi:hypothetical protein
LCVFVAVVCCGPVRACGRCVRGACVCMLVCVCSCVVCVAGWHVGVLVRLRCDGLGLAAVAWTRVCVSWLWCLFVRGCGVCLCALWCDVVCVAMLCGRCWRRRLVWMHVADGD